MLDVEQWAELRREHFVRGVPIKELVRRTGLSRNTVRAALRSEQPPAFRVPERPSKLDPFKDEIHRLLKDDPKLSGVRVREEIEPLGFDGGKSIVDDYLREIRPMFVKLRTHQRTVYRPGEVCQWDLWETSSPVPVGHGQLPARVGRGLLLGLLARRRWRADLQQGGAGRAVGHEPLRVVVGRVAGADGLGSRGVLARGRRPTDRGICGVVRAAAGRLVFCEPADPQAKGAVERLQGYLETNFEPGRRFANHLDFQLQLDAWFEKANARTHKTLRERPIDRLIEERALMRPLPAREPDLDRRWVTRVPPDPHVRFDTNDYSLDPNLVGRRVDVRVSQREIIAVALDTGELAARHERVFAKNKTITALEHARTLRERRGKPGVDELVVEQRPLSVYDQLIA